MSKNYYKRFKTNLRARLVHAAAVIISGTSSVLILRKMDQALEDSKPDKQLHTHRTQSDAQSDEHKLPLKTLAALTHPYFQSGPLTQADSTLCSPTHWLKKPGNNEARKEWIAAGTRPEFITVMDKCNFNDGPGSQRRPMAAVWNV